MSTKIVDFDEATAEMRIILKLQAAIDSDFVNRKNGSYYADQLGIDVFKLNRLSVDYLGKTLYELLAEPVSEENELVYFSERLQKNL